MSSPADRDVMVRPMKNLRPPAIALASLALLMTLAGPAAAGIGAWATGEKARVRLVSAAIDANGRLEGGIEIELAPGWKTYWRTPGAAGIAPQVDFSASTNVKDVVVSYPIPHRYDDGYAVTNVYEGRTILPLAIATGEATEPVDLLLSLDIGVCEEVCIPEHFDAELAVTPGDEDPAAAAVLAEVRQKLPGPPEPGVLGVESFARSGGNDEKPVFDFTLDVPDAKDAEIFVEGPADWYAGVPELVSSDKTGAKYQVTFDRLGADTPIEGAKVTVTIVAADRAVEQTVGLD
jgi:DsbC/DsbD-like thiol-disulfide interchange protein